MRASVRLTTLIGPRIGLLTGDSAALAAVWAARRSQKLEQLQHRMDVFDEITTRFVPTDILSQVRAPPPPLSLQNGSPAPASRRQS